MDSLRNLIDRDYRLDGKWGFLAFSVGPASGGIIWITEAAMETHTGVRAERRRLVGFDRLLSARPLTG